jgi:uncharacterized protein YjiS (DUF1127 family)
MPLLALATPASASADEQEWRMTMYDPKTRKRTFDDHKGPQAVFPAMTEADRAIAYAKDAFKQLTGDPAEERRVRDASTGAVGAMAYAEDIFARVRGDRPNHPYDFGYHLHRHPAQDGNVAQRDETPGTQAEWAVIYAKDVFRRLRGQEPLGSPRPQDEVRQQRRQHPGRAGGGLRDDGRRHLLETCTAKTASFSLSGLLAFATAVGRAMMRPGAADPQISPGAVCARRRRRRIAIAQLEALDSRLLADIGVRRNDIERIVDRLLARRDNAMSASAALSSPTEDRPHDRRLAA